jgi:hypothetical protein
VARVPDTATKPSLAADLEKHLKELTRAGWGGGGEMAGFLSVLVAKNFKKYNVIIRADLYN